MALEKEGLFLASSSAQILCLRREPGGAGWGLDPGGLLLGRLLAVWLWESYLTSLSLGRLIQTTGVIKCPAKAVRRMEGGG